ncbi:SPOSA6832_00643, partial [Sporobolomyces salmonicolor]
MATQRTLTGLVRSVTLHPAARSACALPPSLSHLVASISSPAPSRPFSSTRPRAQASWDSFDSAEAFARPAPPTSSVSEQRPSSSSSSPARLHRRHEPTAPTPPLPPLNPPPSVDDLDPIHLHAYRHHLLLHLGHSPSADDIARHFPRPPAQRARRHKDELVRERIARRAQEKALAREARTEWPLDAAPSRRKHRSSSSSSPSSPSAPAPDPRFEDDGTGEGKDEPPHVPEWKKHQQTLRAQFPDGWAPPKRISREAMDLVRSLHRTAPAVHTVPVLADKFKISPEAVRRVLKSKFELPGDEREKRERKRREERERGRARDDAQEDGGPKWAGDKAAETREMARIRARRSE